MASPSSKRKPKMQPISIAELEGDPTMVGFTSLFRIPTTGQPLPHMVRAEELPPEPSISSSESGHRLETISPTVGDILQPTEGGKTEPTVGHYLEPPVGFEAAPSEGFDSTPSVGGQLSPPSPFFSADDGKFYPHQRVRPLREPKDVLSPVELRAFEKLETLAEPNRHIRIGYDRLAEACSLNEKSVRLLLLRLS